MKKFFVISVAALFSLVMTLPAMAKVKVGGMITQDVYYFHMDANAAQGGVETYPTDSATAQGAFSAFDINLPQALNRINVAYSNDDNSIRGFIQIRGGSTFGENKLDSIVAPASNFAWNYAWIDWVLSPKDFIRFGRQTQAFAILAPDQTVGEARGLLVGNNYGNVHGGTSRDGVRWYHTFTDQVHFQLAIYDPASNGADYISKGTYTTEQSVIPRVDVTVPLFFGNITVLPSFTYLKQKYEDVPAGNADSYTIWGGAVGAKYVVGPLNFQGEITIGQNLGAGNYVGEGGLAVPAVYNNGASINDAKCTAWWFQAGWKVGPATINGIVGSNHIKRDDDLATTDNTNLDRTLWMYGLTVPIAVAKGFTIKPELMFYDNDTNATVGNTETYNYGREYLAGVQFQLVF